LVKLLGQILEKSCLHSFGLISGHFFLTWSECFYWW